MQDSASHTLLPAQDSVSQSLTQVVNNVAPSVGVEGALAIIVGMTAMAIWINEKLFHLPGTIASMLAGLAFALGTLVLDYFGLPISEITKELIQKYPFDKIVLNLVLPFLLFAAAMQIDLRNLKSSGLKIFYLSTIGILVFAAIESVIAYNVLSLLPSDGPSEIQNITWIISLLFATLIAPTDAAAVMSMLRRSNAPPRLRTVIAGESLFNDATSIVFFTVVLAFASSGTGPKSGDIVMELLLEIGGGFLIGGLVGFLGAMLVRFSKDTSTQVMVMVSVVLGGTQLSLAFGGSAPLAMVLAGILISRFRKVSADDDTHPTNVVWKVFDQILNGILFLLVGIELLAIEHWNLNIIIGAVVCFPIIIIARYLSLFIPWTIFNRGIPNRELILLSWCGIRGGVSIALALQIPASIADGALRNAFIMGAFVTVMLSMLIQGISAPKVVEKLSVNLDKDHKNHKKKKNTKQA